MERALLTTREEAFIEFAFHDLEPLLLRSGQTTPLAGFLEEATALGRESRHATIELGLIAVRPAHPALRIETP
jgi:hypothetical protein